MKAPWWGAPTIHSVAKIEVGPAEAGCFDIQMRWISFISPDGQEQRMLVVGTTDGLDVEVRDA